MRSVRLTSLALNVVGWKGAPTPSGPEFLGDTNWSPKSRQTWTY